MEIQNAYSTAGRLAAFRRAVLQFIQVPPLFWERGVGDVKAKELWLAFVLPLFTTEALKGFGMNPRIIYNLRAAARVRKKNGGISRAELRSEGVTKRRAYLEAHPKEKALKVAKKFGVSEATIFADRTALRKGPGREVKEKKRVRMNIVDVLFSQDTQTSDRIIAKMLKVRPRTASRYRQLLQHFVRPDRSLVARARAAKRKERDERLAA